MEKIQLKKGSSQDILILKYLIWQKKLVHFYLITKWNIIKINQI
jgi:hypothetical protein